MIIETNDAPATVTGVSGLIDVHAHFPALAHKQALERSGVGVDGSALPDWNAEQTLDVMGDVGIEYTVLSPASPPPHFADVDDARRTAREFNEELADQIADDPYTYGGVAFLPLPHVDAALEELVYALEVLKLDGAHVVTNYQGRYPGHPMFAPLLEELNRRGTTVMAHATCPADAVSVPGSPPAPPELAVETTRLTSSLFHRGALRRYPDITWILGHGGATIFRTSHVLGDTAGLTEEDAVAVPASRNGDGTDGDGTGRDLLRGLYVDVLGNVDEPMLSGLAELQGPDKLLFGSDMPLECPTRVARGITTLMANAAVGEQVKQAIARDNALRLFPSVARKLRPTVP